MCMQKINFILHFFLKILNFKQSCNFIGWQHFDSKTRILPDGEISTIILVPILDYFQEKLMTKLMKKTYFGPFFAQIWANKKFLGKKVSVSFKIFQVSTTLAKNQKKLMSHSWEKCRTDGRTDGRTDRQKMVIL